MKRARRVLAAAAAAFFLIAISVVAVRNWFGERLLTRARSAQSRGDINGAAELYRRALELGQEDAAVALARMAFGRREWKAVRDYVSQAAALNPARGYLRILEAYALAAEADRWEETRVEAVLEECRRAVKLDPSNPNIWKSYGDIAFGIYSGVLEKRPADPNSIRYRGEMVQAYRQAIRFDPSLSQTILGKVASRYPEAGLLLRISGSDDPRVLSSLVRLLLEEGIWERFRSEYWEEAAASPNPRPFYLAAAKAFREKKRPHQSIEALRKYLSLNPADAEAHFWVADSSFSLPESDWEQVRRHYLRALELDPDNSFYRRGYGRRLLSREETEEATNELKRAVRNNPRDAEAYFLLGKSLEKAGDLKGARTSYLRASAIRPGNNKYRRAVEAL